MNDIIKIIKSLEDLCVLIARVIETVKDEIKKQEDGFFWALVTPFATSLVQRFGREKNGNRGKFICSNLVIFCYKEFEKFVLCKSISQSEVIFIVHFEPIKSGHVKNNFSLWQHIQNVNKEKTD